MILHYLTLSSYNDTYFVENIFVLQAALYLSSGKIAQGGIRRVATPCCIGRECESYVNAATTGFPFPPLRSFHRTECTYGFWYAVKLSWFWYFIVLQNVFVVDRTEDNLVCTRLAIDNSLAVMHTSTHGCFGAASSLDCALCRLPCINWK